MKKMLLAAIIILNAVVFSQTFTEISTIFSDLGHVSAAWGDYDNDGDLDLVITGKNSSGVQISRLFRNEGSFNFTELDIGMPSFSAGVTWGDYDNDGNLDIFFLDWTQDYPDYYTKIMRNNGDGSFTTIDTDIRGWVRLGDFNKDGQIDLINSSGAIFLNQNGLFTQIFPNINRACRGWLDFDRDGDLDILSSDGIFVNNSNESFEYVSKFTGGITSWGDYNNDGYQDIVTSWIYYYDWLVPQPYDADYRTNLYRYNPETKNYSFQMSKLYATEASAWGDYNNDGTLDLLTSGYGWESDPNEPPWDGNYFYTTELNKTESGSVSFDFKLNEKSYKTSLFADIDNDGDLDLFLSGTSSTDVFINNSLIPNLPPNAPGGLASSNSGSKATLSWNKATDSQTPQNGLSYNLYIGTEPGICDIMSPMSDINTGFRRVVKTGNADSGTSFTINDLKSGTYYWSVQAIDHGYAGSIFATEQSFAVSIPIPETPVAGFATDIGSDRFRASWSKVEYAEGYLLDVSTDSLFTTYLSGFEKKDVSNVNSYELTGLSEGFRYYYRLRAYNLDGAESGYSNTISVKTQIVDIIANSSGSVASADLNNNGLMDLVVIGSQSRIYMNSEDGTFTAIDAGFPDLTSSSVDMGDYDNDGFIDILISGNTGSENITRVYKNNGDGTFSDINAGLTGVSNGDARWGDFDNDGKPDILITGSSPSKVFRNEGNGIFTDINAGLLGYYYSSAAWFDFNNSGCKDLIISGLYSAFDERTDIYLNNCDGTFTKVNSGLIGLYNGSVAFGDYDNDGYVDILITGSNDEMVQDSDDNFSEYPFSYSELYRNNGDGTFTKTSNSIIDVYGSGIFADYDNDGLLDIIVSGSQSHYVYPSPVTYSSETKVYKNNGDGTFTDLQAGYLDGFRGKLVVSDFNNDGKPDLLFSGINSTGENKTKIFDCGASSPNTLPSAPSNLSAVQSNNSLTFSWDKSTDIETPQNGLSYNLYIGTEPVTCDVMSPMSDIASGYRRVVGLGNTQQNISWTIKDLAPGTYYWSVQAIDHSFAGSPFAPEQTITLTSIEDEAVPLVTKLYQNYPNPFNPATEIRFSLAEDAKVNLSVYNTNGQLVRTLVDGKTEKGYHTVSFDASELNSGMYFYRLDVNGNVQTRKMLMLK